MQLGSEVDDRGPRCIARTITGASDGFTPRAGDLASWSGIYYASPADAGLEYRDNIIVTPVGHAPAWRIDGDLSTWAIHVHGLGSSRAGTIRGAQVAIELGYTSLVVTYRNDGEGPLLGNGRSTLRVTEVEDVDAAIGYAIRRGVDRIVLFGWSMGAAIALQLAHRAGWFQRASATPSLGGRYGSFMGATVYRVFNATFRLVSTNNSETLQREYRCGRRVGQACRHDHSNGRSGRYRTSERL